MYNAKLFTNYVFSAMENLLNYTYFLLNLKIVAGTTEKPCAYMPLLCGMLLHKCPAKFVGLLYNKPATNGRQSR